MRPSDIWCLILVTVGFILLAGCGDSKEKARRAIDDQNTIYNRAMAKQSVRDIESVYWRNEKVIAFEPEGTYRGSDELKQYWWDFFRGGNVKEFAITENHLDIENETAYEWGLYTLTYQPRGAGMTKTSGRYTRVWRNINNSWVIVVDHRSIALAGVDSTR